MSTKLRISHSAINCYTSCSRKYQLRYVKRMRSKTTSGALLFGGAIDLALNNLLETHDLEESLKIFNKNWSFGFINNRGHHLPHTELVLYAKTDFDGDLLLEEDRKKFADKQYEYNLYMNQSLEDSYSILVDKKASTGFNSLSLDEKRLLNYANWLCLRRKGEIMIRSYADQVLPQIQSVLAVQKSIEIENSEGDKLIGYIDMILEMKDGKRYVADNKTSSIVYEPDSPSHSQQLILYHYLTKEEYKLDGAMFIVMSKHILKHKTKVCSKCKFDGTGGRHKSCANEIEGKRCGGEWIETIRPEAKIDLITNSIPEAAEELVMTTFDEANYGIKHELFGPNLSACDEFSGCEFKNFCWKGESSDIEIVESKSNK